MGGALTRTLALTKNVGSSAPVYTSVGTVGGSAAATTVTPGLPGSVTAAMGLLAIVEARNNTFTHTCGTAGWTNIAQANSPSGSGLGMGMSLWLAQGGAAQPTFTIATGALPAACKAMIVAYTPSGAGSVNGSAFGATSSNNGHGATHSTSGFTALYANSLAVLVDGCYSVGTFGTPSGWTQEGTENSFLGTSWYDKAVALGGSTGSTSLTAPNDDWCQIQFELRMV